MKSNHKESPGFKTLSTIPILDWIKDNSKNGIDFDYGPKWSDFKVIPSIKAYESYKSKLSNIKEDDRVVVYHNPDHVVINNVVKVDDKSLEVANTRFYTALVCLKMTAFNKKVEGYNVGCGQLIIQDRMSVDTSFGSDWGADDKKYSITWYGKIDRIPEDMERIK
ncbi:hypothetical protein KAR91_59550 [Candidatus Pacearchaeota archaeon]|nr:hypothetical protein [Candidatus Pacearchaeota archaeon]